MKVLVFDRACIAGVKFKVADQSMVGFVEVSAVLTPAVATGLGAGAAIFDDGGRPKTGFVRVDLEAVLTECRVRFEVEGAANFVLDLSCPTIDNFVVKRRGNRLLTKFRCGVVGHEQELIEFLKTAGSAEGRLAIDVRAGEQVGLPGIATATAQEEAAQAAAIPPAFSERMRAAKTTDEGQGLLLDHAQMIHSLMTHHGLDPLCGPTTYGYKGFSITTSKERKAAIKALRLKDMGAGDALHMLVEEGVAMLEPWKMLQLMDLKQGFDEPATGEDS